jgi:hypothetical protein
MVRLKGQLGIIVAKQREYILPKIFAKAGKLSLMTFLYSMIFNVT